jgi:hypothetical protein
MLSIPGKPSILIRLSEMKSFMHNNFPLPSPLKRRTTRSQRTMFALSFLLIAVLTLFFLMSAGKPYMGITIEPKNNQ